MKVNETLRAQVWCLSALLLALDSVLQLARRGQIDMAILHTLLPSLLRRDRGEIAEYFQQPEPLNRGRELLLALLAQDIETDYVRYSVQIMRVEKKLSRNDELMGILRRGLAEIQRQEQHFGLTHENVIANIADLYQRTASQAATKILINGAPEYLQQPHIANKIRALMLCAVRAVALWRSYGGSRWQLMFSRQAIAQVGMEAF